MNDIDRCYEILGIKPGASPEEVKQAYRDLAMVWHPDRFPADNSRLKEKAQEELKKINAAYEVLKSHLVSFSANTKSSGSADAKSDRTSSQNSYPPKSEDAITYYEQGMDKAKRGKYQEAIEDFDREILINPNFAEAYKYRGIAHSKLGDKQRAFYDFKQATNLYLRQGNIDDYYSAIELIKKLQTSKSVTTVVINYRRLQELLSAGNWKAADRETFAIMLKIADREKQGYLSAADIKNIPCIHLHVIDQLWVVYSNGLFGFSVQKRIWQSLEGTNKSETTAWCEFCDRIYWRGKYRNLQVNKTWVPYNHLIFNLNATPGHLPAALPGRRYYLRLIVSSLVFMLLVCAIIYSLDSQSSSFLVEAIVLSIGLSMMVLPEICNGNQRHTRKWWKHLF